MRLARRRYFVLVAATLTAAMMAVALSIPAMALANEAKAIA